MLERRSHELCNGVEVSEESRDKINEAYQRYILDLPEQPSEEAESE